MKIKHRSTLALAIALLLGSGIASAADNDQTPINSGVGQLDVTMQVLDESSNEPMSQMELPDVSNDQSAADEDTDGANPDHVTHAHPDNHGKAVSELAHGLKAAHEGADSGHDFANTVHDTLVSVASENAAAHADAAADAASDAAANAAEIATTARDNARDVADTAKEHVADAADIAADAASDAATNAADAAKNHAADAGNI